MARFISDCKTLTDVFVSLCEKYDVYEWSVAWAGDITTAPISILNRYQHKIRHIVVGLHFYQTSPNFIEEYLNHKGVRFIKQTDGTFHPKVYLFYNESGKEWAAIVGSSNFTNHGFNKNIEANIVLTSEDSCTEVFEEMLSFVRRQWESSSDFGRKELENYRECYYKQRRMTQSLAKVIKQDEQGKIETRVFDLKTWDEYEGEVSNHRTYTARIRLLKKARSLFKKPFNTLSIIDRKRLAGCPSNDENQISNDEHSSIDWKFFGSMLGNGDFKHEIIEGNIHIGKAIDSIPLTGEITKHAYEQYIKEFLKAFPTSTNPLATATRLLALKRPDVFICVDGKNKANLCKQYGIHQNHLNTDSYWNLLIKRIQESAWFTDAIETEELFPYRVAMLDCLHYKG